MDVELALGTGRGEDVGSEGVELYRLDGARVLVDLVNLRILTLACLQLLCIP